MNADLKVIAWNVYQGHRPDDVRTQLLGMILAHNPDAIVLSEASGQYGHLEGLGYKVVQLHPGDWRSTPMTETGNIAMLVREDIAIEDRFAMRMRERWLGPKHGIPHMPRVYRWVKVKTGKTVWKLGGFHIPFGIAARQESYSRIRRWFSDTRPGRPVIAVGDMNMSAADYRGQIANPVGATVDGTGIDLTGYKNCTLLWHKSLGNHGSDHPAKLYAFKA
jgi:endonuclease/exonuclease/phosphatase family metal-dependent hydrolase